MLSFSSISAEYLQKFEFLISQVIVAIRWGGRCHMGFVANFIRFPAAQKFWESVKMWRSYREFKGGNFFETQCSTDFPLLMVLRVLSTSTNEGLSAGSSAQHCFISVKMPGCTSPSLSWLCISGRQYGTWPSLIFWINTAQHNNSSSGDEIPECDVTYHDYLFTNELRHTCTSGK